MTDEPKHGPDLQGGIDLSTWLSGESARQTLLAQRAYLRDSVDRAILGREDQAWTRSAYVEYFFFGYDSAWFDAAANRFDVDAFLDDAEANLGGVDQLVLWQPYPRMGMDRRSQIDFWRDWPGGLGAFIGRCHDRGVRCLLNHVRWDQNRPHTWAEDMVDFGKLYADYGADGIYADTLAATPPEIRRGLDAVRPGIVIESEYNAPLRGMAVQTSSWSQGHRPTPLHPFIQPWVDPRYMIRMVNRGASDRTGQIADALFWGHGIAVWENVFGWWNPLTAADRARLQKVAPLLRAYHDAFVDLDWSPLDYRPAEGVYGNRFRDGDRTAITLRNTTDAAVSGARIHAPGLGETMRAFDVWNGIELTATTAGGGDTVVTVEADCCGMVVIQPAARPEPPMAPRRAVGHRGDGDLRFWPSATEAGVVCITGFKDGPIVDYSRSEAEQAERVYETDFRRRVTTEAMQPKPVAHSTLRPTTDEPAEGMARIPGARFVMSVTHRSLKLEGGCYGNTNSMDHPLQYFWLDAYWLDVTEVTNAAFAEFVRDASYRPARLERFLDHWTKPDADDPATWSPPKGREQHPVVWVDLEDARAYAAWAGKRLPTEAEWQYAAEGGQGRRWPWGDRFEPGRCNHDTDETAPVDAFPSGASAFGVLDLAGNVWEWTESERHDGHTRYAILRGGSHLIHHPGDHPESWGKMWYVAEGAQHNRAHQKMLLIAPSLDRCGTVGFRCAADQA